MYRIAPGVTLHLGADGSLAAWSPGARDHVSLSSDQIALLAAFGTGHTAEAAAEDAGFSWDDTSRTAVAGLASRGLLIACASTDEREAVDQLFDDSAADWTDSAYGGRARRGVLRLELVVQSIDAFARERTLDVLELGCGAGRLASALAARGHRVTAIDRSPGMLELARAEVARLPVDQASRVTFARQDVLVSPPSPPFDLVVALGLLPYLADEAALFEHARRVLRADGLLIVTAANRLADLWTSAAQLEDAIAVGDASALLAELERHVRGAPAVPRDRLVRALHDGDIPTTPSRMASPHGHAVARRMRERALTPDELAAKARSWFDCVTVQGFMPPWFGALAAVDATIAAALSAPFVAFAGHPAALAWSDELVAVFRPR